MPTTECLPVNMEAERFVLGSVLLNEELMHAARPVLLDSDFSTDQNQRIWKRACAVYDAGSRVEPATLLLALKDAGDLEASGGFPYILSLEDGLPQLPNIEHYVKAVKEKATLRRLMAISQHALRRCASGDGTSAEIIDAFSQQLVGLAPQAPGQGLQSMKDFIDEVGVSALLSPRRDRGLMFPWSWMNHVTCGMLPAELWVLAAHTSNGKTSAMMQHAVAAARRGVGVGIFSLEVEKGDLAIKACSQLARVSSTKVREGRLNTEETAAMRRALEELYTLPLYLDTQSSNTMAIHAGVRRLRASVKLDHVIVDQLQLLGNSARHGSRAEAVGANAWALKMLATEFKIPVLMLSQFNREGGKSEKRGGPPPEPRLSDLKESGDIENHANAVWAIHRECYDDVMEQVPVKFMILKQRDGRRNIHSNLVFVPRYQRFEETTSEEEWSAK